MPRLTEGRFEETYPGAGYSPEEIEFILAIERCPAQARRPFPTWHEVLQVFKSLGYRKEGAPGWPEKGADSATESVTQQ